MPKLQIKEYEIADLICDCKYCMNFVSPPLTIIGMHRSGTSMLTRIFERAGIFMGADLSLNHESLFFRRINKVWLENENFYWDNPGVPKNVDLNLYSTASFMRHYVRILKQPLKPFALLNANSWGWKDPRTTFTIAHWLKVFPNAKVIHIYRNGMDVALSLYRRNLNFDKSSKWHSERLENKINGFKLWEEYITQAEISSGLMNEKLLPISFEKLMAEDEITISQLENFVGRKLSTIIKSEIDHGIKTEFKVEDHIDLFEKARQSEWMRKLNYL